MSKEIKVPHLGESITEATISKWLKHEGDAVKEGEVILEVETDKVTLEVAAEISGVLKKVKYSEGDTVKVGDIVVTIDEKEIMNKETEVEKPKIEEKEERNKEVVSSPSAKVHGEIMGIDLRNVEGSAKGGIVTKKDVLLHSDVDTEKNDPRTKEVTLSPLRQRIAARLKQSQNEAAILTTFNEVDVSEVMSIRAESQEKFQKKYGVKLGLMSFFAKAVVEALKAIPEMNSELRENKIIYKNYYNIGIAVSTENGLVVPVLKDVDKKGFHEIEKELIEYAKNAREGKLSIEAMQDGTFTITNGGIYGSLLSTPILNPPQVGILGMHNIIKRPVVVDDKIVIRPMMYMALSYDHRIIDGKGAVTFLKIVKEVIEEPCKMLLGLEG